MEIKKIVTFIYSDTAEKNNYAPIAEEAEKRGYKVFFTMDKFAKCEIGFYCQHVNFPRYSKFSVIMLHDITQQYGNWPDLWYREPWNKYDIGILPSKLWEDNWNKCSQWYYARPRVGMYKVGWPKADVISKLKKNSSKEEFYAKHGLDVSKRTILYAPAWENDHKQDDFVQSMLKLNVNILIKQAKWADSYSQIIANIKEMYHLHKDIPRVTILPPETNIFEAIAVSDVLVSEESSTMCEATMMEVPVVSVSNWLIPDVTPSRFPQCDYDFAVKTPKENLTECVRNIIDNYDCYHMQVKEFSEKTFCNIGMTSKIIMDIIDDCLNGCQIRYEALQPNPNQSMTIRKMINQKITVWKRNIPSYSKHNKIVKLLWTITHNIHHMFD